MKRTLFFALDIMLRWI